MNSNHMSPLQRALHVRALAHDLAEALHDIDDSDDPTNTVKRDALVEVLAAAGVEDLRRTPYGTLLWAFFDGDVEEGPTVRAPSSPTSTRERVEDAANDLGDAILGVDPSDEDAAETVRLSLRGVLDVVREHLPGEWEATVLHEVAGLIRSDLTTGKVRVQSAVLKFAIDDGLMRALLIPDETDELIVLWGNPVVTDLRWGPDDHAFERIDISATASRPAADHEPTHRRAGGLVKGPAPSENPRLPPIRTVRTGSRGCR
jgi:hypothetical protein